MKSILLFCLSLFMVSSCVRSGEDSHDLFTSVNRLKFEGHKYIEFFNHKTSYPVRSVVHDPECECFKNKLNE